MSVQERGPGEHFGFWFICKHSGVTGSHMIVCFHTAQSCLGNEAMLTSGSQFCCPLSGDHRIVRWINHADYNPGSEIPMNTCSYF